jgi:hypothetical protein
MDNQGRPVLWRALTSGQRAMLRRLEREGPLISPKPWEMRTIRSLLARGLVRPRLNGRDGRKAAGLWFLSAKGARILPRRAIDDGAAEIRIGP